MPEVRLTPVPQAILELESSAVPHVINWKLPPGDVKPFRLINYSLDSYRIRNGWPHEVPDHDIRGQALISIEGDVLSYRPDATAVDVLADVRWVASPDYYDRTALIWWPSVSNFGDWQWNSAPDFAPEIDEDYTYRIGSSLITQTAVTFNSENRDHFWSNFYGGIVGAQGFTFYMVASISSPGGSGNVAGLLSPGRPTPVGADEWQENVGPSKQFHLQMLGNEVAIGINNSPPEGVHPVSNWISRQTPIYIFAVVKGDHVDLYVATGPNTTLFKRVQIGEAENFSLNMVLGRTTGSLLQTADMALFETGFYANLLSRAQVRTEIAKVSSIYGGS